MYQLLPSQKYISVFEKVSSILLNLNSAYLEKNPKFRPTLKGISRINLMEIKCILIRIVMIYILIRNYLPIVARGLVNSKSLYELMLAEFTDT